MSPAPSPEQAPEEQALSVDALIELLGPDLTDLASSALNDEYASERRVMVNRARRNWRFIKGDQFLAPDWVDQGDGEIADFVSVEGTQDAGGATQKFCYAINVLAADLWKFDAVLGQGSPNVQCAPDDVDDQEAIEDSKKAEISCIDFKEKWDSDSKQHELAFHQFVTGPIFGLTRYITNRKKYGQVKVPKMGIAIGPDGMPMPVPQGEETYDNGDVELHLANILQVAIPFGKKTLQECEWLNYEYLENRNTLLSIPGYRNRLKEGREEEYGGADRDSATSTALEAQEATAVPSGTGRPMKRNHWLLGQMWFDYENFEGIKDKNKRQIAQKHFPSGLHATRINSQWVDLEDEDKNKVWAVCKVGRGPYILENPICHDSIPFQKAINDIIGLMIETILRAIPKTIMDQALIDRKSLSENEATVGEVILTSSGNLGDLNKMIAELPTAHFSDQSAPFLTMFRGVMQDVNGIRPELSGGGAPTQTYREAKQRKDQAMMTISPPAKEHGKFWEQAYSNGTRQRAKYATGKIKINQKGSFGVTSKAIDAEDLTDGKWHCEADDGIPMSFTERADRILGLLKEFPPEVLQMMEITSVVNITELLHLLQLSGFKSPMEAQYKRVLKTIAMLAQEEPVQNMNPDGSPGQPLPSIQLDPVRDDPAFNFKVCQVWMDSDEGLALEKDRAESFANVKAYAGVCKQAATPAPPPPPPTLPPKMTFSAKYETLSPDVQQKLLEDAHLVDANSPPLPPAIPPAPKMPAMGQGQPDAQTEPLAPAPIEPQGAPQPVLQ